MGTWGVGMQANDTALDAISGNEKNPVRALKVYVKEYLEDGDDDYRSSAKGILGLADLAMDLGQNLNEDLKKTVLSIIESEMSEEILECWKEPEDRKAALERLTKRINGEKVKDEDLAKDNEGLFSKIFRLDT